MNRLGIDLYDNRCPVWESPSLLFGAAGSGELLHAENDAISSFSTDDPNIRNSNPNEHKLWIGSQQLLHGFANEAFLITGSMLEEFSDWRKKQKEGFLDVFCSFFPPNEAALGTFSITSARRRAVEFRKELGQVKLFYEDRHKIQRPNATIQLGGGISGYFNLPVSKLHFAHELGAPRAKFQLAQMQVHRRVDVARFRLNHSYEETWTCSARRGDDEGRLRQGQIPAIDPRNYQGRAGRINTAPIITLAKIDARLNYTMLSIEIHPVSGEIFSVRFGGSVPLAVRLLNAAPVEHKGVCQALRERFA
jgi:hypothetical protein